jgi:hypothetical protein
MESFGVDVSGGFRLPRPEALMTDSLLLKQATTDLLKQAAPALLRQAAPALLPSDPRGFAGRCAELCRLDHLGGGDIAMLSGPGGVGKTALALRWGHRSADRFPDGQLFVNLRGFDHVAQPMEPGEALRRFLAALGVPPRHVPDDPRGQVAVYRAEMADRRALVVLDNATAATQVRPLLPHAPGCVTVVTGRNQLTGLMVRERAQPTALPPLTTADAAQLLINRLGWDRIARDPLSVAAVIDRCARMPLALSLLTARAGGRPLAEVAAEIGPADGCDNPHADVRSVFAWTYRMLTPPAAGMFRQLGRHPGYDITATAAAALAGLGLGPAAVILAELARAGLLTEFTPGRYTCHDLLRAYAAELFSRSKRP